MKLVLLCLCTLLFYGQEDRLQAADLKILTGKKWKGKLTYLDYTSNKRSSIPAELLVRASADKSTWYFMYAYPKEPHANSIDTMVLEQEGRVFGAQRLLAKKKLANKIHEWITEKTVQQAKGSLLFRYSYTVSPGFFSISKREKAVSDSPFIERYVYEFRTE